MPTQATAYVCSSLLEKWTVPPVSEDVPTFERMMGYRTVNLHHDGKQSLNEIILVAQNRLKDIDPVGYEGYEAEQRTKTAQDKSKSSARNRIIAGALLLLLLPPIGVIVLGFGIYKWFKTNN